jgi:peroxiredoxin
MKKLFAVALVAAALAAGSAGNAEPKKSEGTMGEHDSHAGHAHAHAAEAGGKMTKAEVGQPAPQFALTGLDGKEFRLADHANEVVVLEWFNPDCPFVQKHHKKFETMETMAAKYGEKGVVWVAINSGAPGKQGAGKDRNAKAVSDFGIDYPLLLDESGTVGRMYEAKTTPHMFVIDKGTLVYAGAIDDNRSPATLGETNYVQEALDAVLAGEKVANAQTKPYGCSVKYGATAL